MKRRRVVLSSTARADLDEIADWLTDVASPDVAERYLGSILTRLQSLEYGSERGTLRQDDDGRSYRLIGLMKSVGVAFEVGEEAVTVFRVLYRGRAMEDDPRAVDETD